MAVQRTTPLVVTRKLGPVRVWREGLGEIVDLIQQAHPVSVLHVGDYTCDRIDDLAELADSRVSRFALESDDKLVTLILDQDVAEISAVDPDLTTRGMLSEIEGIAHRHARPTVRPLVFSVLLPLILMSLVGAVLAQVASSRLSTVRRQCWWRRC